MNSGVDAVRYSFIVTDLHHLLLAGLPAHSALPPEADVSRPVWNVRSVPAADIGFATSFPAQSDVCFSNRPFGIKLGDSKYV